MIIAISDYSSTPFENYMRELAFEIHLTKGEKYADRFFREFNSKLTWDQKDKLYQKRRSEFTKNKVALIDQNGYDDYYLVNAKDMKVENADISQVNADMKVGKIKQLFSKSMKGRITSRVLLNKFIEKVA